MKLAAAWKKFDLFLDQHCWVLILFLFIILLRLPNFFEPYWYGDEAIYLTLGQAIDKGRVLYSGIIDHKTPLIYYLATVGDQFSFRLLLLFWMLWTTAIFYQFAKKLFPEIPAKIASVIMVLLTTLPWLEGNIPNGELFVMGFTLTGAYLLSKTEFFRHYLNDRLLQAKLQLKEKLLFLAAGVFFSLGILTKVPALLDLFAFAAVFVFYFVSQFFQSKNSDQQIKRLFWQLLQAALIFAIGVMLPILLSVLYFSLQGALQDYLDYGLLYNLRYSQSWQQDFGSAFSNFSFSLLGKSLYLLAFFLLLLFNSRSLSPRYQLISLWFVATLYSVLLSSRPYPHYFLQMVPVLALLIVELISAGQKLLKTISKRQLLAQGKVLASGILLLLLTFYILIVFNFRPYETLSYYQRFVQLATGQISLENYENAFNPFVADNREVSRLIKEIGLQEVFIWGTNPMLYAQANVLPSSRFTVSFHIKDFNDYQTTFAQVEAAAPKLIIVMDDEKGDFPQLEKYLRNNYIPNTQYRYMTLYLRR